MSITRLQQARQMYAMGKRVGRIAFGGGGSQGDSGYQGGQNESDKATGGQGGSSGTGTDNRGSTGGSNDNPFSSGYQGAVNQTKTATPMDVKEQYAVGNDITLGAPISPPDFTKVGPGSTMDDNRIKALNLAGSTYKPFNIPPFVPGGMLLNTVGNFIGGIGAKKNRQFFADNVAGKYGFGYGMDAYKDYMRQRMAGEVGAYGNENMGQNAIDARARDGGGGGIMDVYTDNTTDDTTDNTTTEDELLLRFLGEDSTLDPAAAGVANTDELRAMILERAKNLYT